MFDALQRLFKGEQRASADAAPSDPSSEARASITITARMSGQPTPIPPPAQRHAIYTSEYLPRDQEDEITWFDEEGRLTLRLRPARNSLVLTAPSGEWINPYSPRVRRLGITIFTLRGTAYYPEAVKAADFSPGTEVRLVREPDNPHDANAIAVYALDGVSPAGYVNEQNAARLSKKIDSGEELVATAIQGEKPGRNAGSVMVLISDPDTVQLLYQPR